MSSHAAEVKAGERFEFGANWRDFLSRLSEERIRLAEDSLRDMLETRDLNGRRFLDAGSGSGLFSLCARRLGARVHSFDYDPNSVACTRTLRQTLYPGDPDWTVEEGSVLDQAYLKQLGEFDIVYSWGVLHHTGNMWQALANLVPLVKPGGMLFVSIYNDQGSRSRRWMAVKRFYNALPGAFRFLVLLPCAFLLWWRPVLRGVLRGRPLQFFEQGRMRPRGMSRWHDLVDWVGGYPFEVARPEGIFDFYRARGFVLTRLITAGGSLGTNEFVFRKE